MGLEGQGHGRLANRPCQKYPEKEFRRLAVVRWRQVDMYSCCISLDGKSFRIVTFPNEEQESLLSMSRGL